MIVKMFTDKKEKIKILSTIINNNGVCPNLENLSYNPCIHCPISRKCECTRYEVINGQKFYSKLRLIALDELSNYSDAKIMEEFL